VEIFNSFELVLDPSGKWAPTDDYLRAKQEQFKKVFKDYDFLGWYATGRDVTAREHDIHKQMLQYNESPLFLLLDPTINAGQKDLPVTLFESEVHIVKDQPSLLLAKTPFKIETGEAERISVDHVAHLLGAGSSSESSTLAAHLGGLQNAIKMLQLRLRVIVQFLESTSKGKTPPDYAILRLVSELVNQLPAIDTAKFKDEFISEFNDGLLITYLASITKTANNMNELADKFNVIDKYSRRSELKRFF